MHTLSHQLVEWQPLAVTQQADNRLFPPTPATPTHPSRRTACASIRCSLSGGHRGPPLARQACRGPGLPASVAASTALSHPAPRRPQHPLPTPTPALGAHTSSAWLGWVGSEAERLMLLLRVIQCEQLIHDGLLSHYADEDLVTDLAHFECPAP